MLEIIKCSDIIFLKNMSEKISLYWLFYPDSLLNNNKMLSSESITIAKKFREYSSMEKRENLFHEMNRLNFLFKNQLSLQDNFNKFFGTTINLGEEDAYGLFFNKKDKCAIILKTSDFGINLSYFKNNLTLDNISKEDMESVELGFSLICLAAESSVKASIKLNEKNLEEIIPEKIVSATKLLKF